LISQPGVARDVIAIGGEGALGVLNSVETARRQPAQVKSLVLMSGETLRPQLQFLHQASQLPELFVVSDDDEYPPTQQAMQLLYVTAIESEQETGSLFGRPGCALEMVRTIRHRQSTGQRRSWHRFV